MGFRQQTTLFHQIGQRDGLFTQLVASAGTIAARGSLNGLIHYHHCGLVFGQCPTTTQGLFFGMINGGSSHAIVVAFELVFTHAMVVGLLALQPRLLSHKDLSKIDNGKPLAHFCL